MKPLKNKTKVIAGDSVLKSLHCPTQAVDTFRRVTRYRNDSRPILERKQLKMEEK
jgi:hypothetical protein